MLSPNPYMTLSTALGFSAADINANRQGVLTPYQRGILIGQRTRALVWLAVLALFLLGVGYVLRLEFLLVAFISACLMTMMVAAWRRFQDDLESPVEVVVGRWEPHTLSLGRKAAVINGQTFTLPKHLINAFSEHVRYRLYYTSGTRTILSAEIL